MNVPQIQRAQPRPQHAQVRQPLLGEVCAQVADLNVQRPRGRRAAVRERERVAIEARGGNERGAQIEEAEHVADGVGGQRGKAGDGQR